ncbi:hypothetical protein BU15DRAFT_62651 [Melanogaster broomeanus]|nr:hypothetical protein BU15DRAFT_62651 [Melanogaster broomeanus]
MSSYTLPPTLLSWTKIHPFDPEDRDAWWKPWESLRSFFESKGCYLFQPGGPAGDLSTPKPNKFGIITSPAQDSFGLCGEREGYKSMFSRNSVVFAARDSHDRDVAIKIVRKGDEGLHEYNILRLLNSEPLRSHPGNATVAIVEFIEYKDWHFAIMPLYDDVYEGLDFAEQVLSYSSDQAISFLHDNCVAHLDISHENIVMNHRGKIPDHYRYPSADHVPFRSTFPVRYLLLDFGRSVHSALLGPGSGCLVDPLSGGRPGKAPESIRTKFDPYAADVYQSARFLYAWMHEVVPDVPGLLSLFQDMTYFNPSRRISARQAVARLRKLRVDAMKDPVCQEALYRPRALLYYTFPMVPLRHWSWLWDAICLGHFAAAWDLVFMWEYRRELIREAMAALNIFSWGQNLGAIMYYQMATIVNGDKVVHHIV